MNPTNALTRILRTLIVLALGLAALVVVHAHDTVAEVIVDNNSFESPVIGGTFQEYTTPTNWTLSQNVGIATAGGPYFSPATAPDGLQASFTKSATGPSWLGQRIAFPQDGSYAISFYAVARCKLDHSIRQQCRRQCCQRFGNGKCGA